jgi:flagellar biosynthesis protein FlhB
MAAILESPFLQGRKHAHAGASDGASWPRGTSIPPTQPPPVATQQQRLDDVLWADVVVESPAPYAVALIFRRPSAAGACVLAKGHTRLASQITLAAQKYHIPSIQNNGLAEALSRTAKLGQPVPVGFFRAVERLFLAVGHLSRRP